jgi:hypothetical protein
MARDRYLQTLIDLLVEYGADPEQMPQQWTRETLDAAHHWLGIAVVRARLNPPPKRKRGRAKGEYWSDSDEAKNKRNQRDSLARNLDRPFLRYEKIKRGKYWRT